MNSIKNELAKRAIMRANSGFYFIDECLSCFHRGSTDGAFSRSLYILFSYNFELLLKSRVLLASHSKEKNLLLNEIKSHDLELLFKKLSKSESASVNLKKVTKSSNSAFTEYYIQTNDGKSILIQDFVDVRYDFGKDSLRQSTPNESERMKNEVQTFLAMTKQIMEMVVWR